MLKIIKKISMPIAIVIILIALVFSLFRALTPWAKQYKGDVEHQLSVLLGQPVVIKSMETSWYWFQPVLRLNQISVLNHEQAVIQLNKLMVGIDLFRTIWSWHIQPGILYLEDTHLTLRQINHQWQIDGLLRNKTTISSTDYLPTLSWLLGQQKIVIKNVSAQIYLNDHSLLPVTAVNLTAVNNKGNYRLRGEATLAQTTPTRLLILAHLQLLPYSLNTASGRIYCSIQHLLPTQWQSFIPQNTFYLEGGVGNLEMWTDIAKGKVARVQTKLALRHLAWSKYASSKNHFIQSLDANLAWKPDDDGWQLLGDHLKLQLDGFTWPENAILMRYQRSKERYRFFIKRLVPESIFALNMDWPEALKPVISMHPTGILSDNQIEFQNNELSYFLTRFTQMSWKKSADFPGVENVGGVLHWQPGEGHLELDATNLKVGWKAYPTTKLDELNLALEWKTLSHGLRVTIDRLVLRRQDLLFGLEGMIDDALSPNDALVQLRGTFSANHVEQWLPYLPSKSLKPKLADWLLHDIKRIQKANGEFVTHGKLSDFPFDKAPGEFSITTHLNGVDLYFNKEWPLTTDIDGTLIVNKRKLEAEVSHADLKGLVAENVNLRIDELGLGKDTLLVHGQVVAPGEKALAYLMGSPLKQRLSKLKHVEIKGPIAADIGIEAPLYPENDDILAEGTVTFKENKVIFHQASHEMEWNHVNGVLAFNEKGVKDSDLVATWLLDPMNIHIRSLTKPKPGTKISINANTSVEALHQKFPSPLFAHIHGNIDLQSELLLTADPKDMDHLLIKSDLAGVGIDLPAPFNKTTQARVPFTVDVGFNPETAMRLQVVYGQQLSSDVWFKPADQGMQVDHGEVRIGAGQAKGAYSPGIRISGELSHLDMKQWESIFTQQQSNQATSTPQQMVNALSFHVGELKVGGHLFPDVTLEGKKVNTKTWSLQLKQPNAAGEFQYQQDENKLSGHMQYLKLSPALLEKSEDNTPPLKPADVPNLNLTIDAFTWGDVEVGSIALKGSSTNSTWDLQDCKIKSPGYWVDLKAKWTQTAKHDHTSLQGTLKLNSLAKSLAQWKIDPAVEANDGNVEADVSWGGPLYKMSIAQVQGQLKILLKNGRITNLSPETEEKLGLGKLLSILSLQTIPRRLKLDFSDLSKGGYSFDIFTGAFALKEGVMSTQDSYIDGPVAYASMKGDLDLSKQQYDLLLRVSPHITASLPVVATIAGGPIAGLATWVASKIINKGMQQVSGYTYKITGPWKTPVVQQVSISKKKIKPDQSSVPEKAASH